MNRQKTLREAIALKVYKHLSENYQLNEELSTAEYVRAIQELMNQLARAKGLAQGTENLVDKNGKWNSSVMNPAYAKVIRACAGELQQLKPDIDIDRAAKKGSYLAKQFDSSGPKGVTAALKAVKKLVSDAKKPVAGEEEAKPKAQDSAPQPEEEPAAPKDDKAKPISSTLKSGFLKSTKHKPGKKYDKFGGNLRNGITISAIKNDVPEAYNALMDPEEGGDVGAGSKKRENSDLITQVYMHTTDKLTPEELANADFQSLDINPGRFNQILFQIGRTGGTVQDYRGSAPWARKLAQYLLFGTTQSRAN